MSERRGFYINATTMGLSTSRPPTPDASAQPTVLQTLDLFQQASTASYQQQGQELSSTAVPESMPTAESTGQESVQMVGRQLLNSVSAISKVGCGGEAQPSRGGRRKPLTTEHYRSQVERLKTICGDSANMAYELNNKYVKRLEEIDGLDKECGGDSLRLTTLEDWAEQLLDMNYMMFGNITAMEMETYEKIMTCFQSVRGEQQQVQDENRKLRKDMCAIIKLVQQAFHYNNWNTDGICLETLSVNQLLGIPADQSRPESETEKLAKHMKCLANEVAAKHDEVCSMQSQMRVLDEVVQTAHQKIILKDECIAQLNQQLMELQECVENRRQTPEGKSGWAHNRDGSSCVDLYSSIANLLLNDINEKDYHMEDLLSLLNKELSELIDMISNKDQAAVQASREMLVGFFEKIFNERAMALHKLEKLRNHLRALVCTADRLDTPVASSTLNSEDEIDMDLIGAVRRRIETLNESNKELDARFRNMEVQYRVQFLELRSATEIERNMNIKNGKVLKDIADLLSKLRGCNFSYEELYKEKNSNNPFIIAIMEMYDKLEVLENRQQDNEFILADNNNESTTTAARKE